MEELMEKGLLEQIETCAQIFYRITIPLVILILGICLINSYSKREASQKYIEIAVGILNDKPTPETLPLRDWAIRTLNLYSDKKLSSKAREALMTYPIHNSRPMEVKPPVEEHRAIDEIKP
jgi:hypothetical protein